MQTAYLLVALSALPLVLCHSWLGCTDYRGPVDYYDDSKCFAYPRQWEAKRAGNLAQIEKGYQLAADTGYNYMPGDACNLPISSPASAGYTTNYPMAIYEQGAVYCLAWPLKNHAAATCTNQYIPDTKFTLYRSGINPTTDPTQATFNQNEVTHYFGTHTDGTIDCLGFQRTPKFCDNTGASMATGCFSVPSNLAVGTYVYQWYWEFNPGSVYTTCWDAQIVAAGSASGRGVGGLSYDPDNVVDNLGGATAQTCQNNWKIAGNSAPTAGDTPDDGDGGDIVSPDEPTDPGVGHDLTGTDVRIYRYPSEAITTGSFDVDVAYSADEEIALIVDILTGTQPRTWYGKGVYEYLDAGTAGTQTVSVEIYNTPPQGSNYILRAWVVTRDVWEAYLEYQENGVPVTDGSDQPWNYELAVTEVDTSFGDELVYTTSDDFEWGNPWLGSASARSFSVLLLVALAAVALFAVIH